MSGVKYYVDLSTNRKRSRFLSGMKKVFLVCLIAGICFCVTKYVICELATSRKGNVFPVDNKNIRLYEEIFIMGSKHQGAVASGGNAAFRDTGGGLNSFEKQRVSKDESIIDLAALILNLETPSLIIDNKNKDGQKFSWNRDETCGRCYLEGYNQCSVVNNATVICSCNSGYTWFEENGCKRNDTQTQEIAINLRVARSVPNTEEQLRCNGNNCGLDSCIDDGDCSELEKCVSISLASTVLVKTCRSPCENYTCGPNAACFVNNHSPKCVCESGYDWNPYLGCYSHINRCNFDWECSDSETCATVNGFVQICQDACNHEDLHCPVNSRCVSIEHKAKCECYPGFIFDNSHNAADYSDITCHRVHSCSKNSDCLTSEVCYKDLSQSFDFYCKSACEVQATSLQCNREFERCVAHEHTARCECDFNNNFFHCAGLVDEFTNHQLFDCNSDTDCEKNEKCVLSRGLQFCDDVCAVGLNNCDSLAKCRLSSTNHTAECLCPDSSIVDPDVPCIDARRYCLSNANCEDYELCTGDMLCEEVCAQDFAVCPKNTLCVASNHSPVCKCLTGYSDDGKCEVILECEEDEDCWPGKFCFKSQFGVSLCLDIVDNTITSTAVTPVVDCSSDDDCNDTSGCFGNCCVDFCESEPCGENADCAVVGVRRICSCPAGYTGDPYDSCRLSTADLVMGDCGCIRGEICIVDRYGNHVCRAICKTNRDCYSDQTCTPHPNGEVKHCDFACYVNPIKCGHNAMCSGVNHESTCQCREGYKGDPHRVCHTIACLNDTQCSAGQKCGQGRGKCVDACEGVSCPNEAPCKGIDHVGVCQCPYGQWLDKEGVACIDNDECSSLGDCNYTSVCVWDPIRGHKKCEHGCLDFKCGLHEHCLTIAHIPQCRCLEGYRGNHQDGCRLISTSSGSAPRPAATRSKKVLQDVCKYPKRTDIRDMGLLHYFHSWADVQGQGCKNDYCRFSVHLGDVRILTCALSGNTGDYNFNASTLVGTDYRSRPFMQDVNGDDKADFCTCDRGAHGEVLVNCMLAQSRGFGSAFLLEDRVLGENGFIGLSSCRKFAPRLGMIP